MGVVLTIRGDLFAEVAHESSATRMWRDAKPFRSNYLPAFYQPYKAGKLLTDSPMP